MESQYYISLHEQISKRIQDGSPFFSLEFLSPKPVNNLANFFYQVRHMSEGRPLFVSVAWHLSSDPGNISKERSSTSVACGCLYYCAVDTMLHVTCTQYAKEQSVKHIEQCKAAGIRSILALRGDIANEDKNLEAYMYRALDLIRWIRADYDDYFSIACSGYPEGHPNAPSYGADILYLKSKVDAGANFIITQFFFEVGVFENFLADCRKAGIKVPIIPGVLPIQSYASIQRIVELSKNSLPDFVKFVLEPIRHNDEAVRNYGIHLAVTQCRDLLNKCLTTCIHLYTLNRYEASRQILQELGLWTQKPMRTLPWKSCGSCCDITKF